MEYNIEIEQELAELLENIAAHHSLTAQQYAQNIVVSWLEGQYRGEMIRQINETSVTDLKDIKSTIDSVIIKEIIK